MQMTKYFPSFFNYPWKEVFVQEHKGQKINGCIALVTAMPDIVQFLKTAVSHNLTLPKSIFSPNLCTTHKNLDRRNFKKPNKTLHTTIPSQHCEANSYIPMES